ncbi:Two-component hybrid sensor and response regulator histidine kinase [Desulfamplus magnetovallimortis]|uniref:Sensory/regulatory protein RpfC n=1 Tax=Desulfamplus magnetovallimortis TaxID=1246637 RepID=A0A1W1HAH2_9BACT|nr:response regulator [Desulfamplus magnetovallimortis]SLM29443.1 Two-component hybrid sensor and response regulator histidine kinase [Desulfamplus magnetovallimortis]
MTQKRKISENSLIRKILVVDDDKGLRSILTKSFEVIGFTCSEAEDAAAAYEMICQGSFDLVISDISMPVMDGIELMKKVKLEYPELDFIIMTGFSGEYSYVDIIDAGASDYMTKPFGINSAVARIERIEREKRTLLNLKKTNTELNLAIEKAEKLAEEAKALAEEAKAASRAKTDFLANMSHEIRTPLNGILGYIDIFYDTALTHEQKEYVQNAKISCEVLLSVVNDILDFSKVEAGQLSIEKIEFDPEVLCFEALEVVRSKVNEARVEMACKISDSVPGFVLGDPYRFRQVLLNLLGNAAKFTSSGMIELSLDVENEDDLYVQLHARVKDTGIGIPGEKLADIFEPFQQSDETTTRKFGGTGLGLAICRKIAEKMNGRVWAESEAGKGSVFNFTCRVDKHDVKSEKRLRPVSLYGKNAFLCISENSPLKDIIYHELTLAGMKLKIFHNDTISFDEFCELPEPFHIGIVDATLKNNYHLEFGEKFRKLPGAVAKIPLLVCISPDPGGADRCSRAGYNGFLSKPVQRKKLFHMISALLGLDPMDKSSGDDLSENETQKILTSHSLAESMKRSVNILLVEDNMVNQKMAKIMLSKAGYNVTIAGNGVDAVATYVEQKDELDLIFMDINMPEMDGLEATRRIRAIETTDKRIPIVALTANAMKEFEEKCLDVGMDDFLTKPLKRELVFQSVKKWVINENMANSNMNNS